MLKTEFWNYLFDNYNIILNDKQKLSCVHESGPSLTLAIPGSGKTTLLVCRTHYLSKVTGVPESSILCLTFSRAAAADMKRRYEQIFKVPAHTVFSTIHSHAYKLLKLYYSKIGKSFPLLVGSSDSVPGMKKLVLDACRAVGVKNVTSDVGDEYINYISLSKNLKLSSHESKVENQSLNFGSDSIKSKVYEAYEALKSSLNLIDFDDMILLTSKVLREDAAFRDAATRQFKYVMLDEAQDTSRIQNELIDILVSAHGNLFAVADDDQSIYGFRGAFPESVIEFKNRFKALRHIREPRIYGLEINYRSTPPIIKLSDKIISMNIERHRKKMIPSSNEHTGVIELHNFETIEQRNDFILNIDFMQNDFKNKTVGILYRNNVSAILTAYLMISSDIRFQISDSCSSFFDSFVFKDIISFLEHSLNPSDFDSLKRIYYKTNHYVTKDSIWYSDGKGDVVLEEIQKNPFLKSWQKKNIQNLNIDFKTLSKLSPSDAVSFICNNMGYFEFLAKYSRNITASLEGMKSIIDALKDISVSYAGILDFLIEINQFRENIKYHSGIDDASIRLTTIHSSKGLEFDNVIIIDAEHGIIPSYESLDKLKHGDSKMFEEERRLFYVAMTRAKSNLLFLMSKYRYGSKTVNSVFIEDVVSASDSLGKGDFVEINHFNDEVVCEDELYGRKLKHFKYGLGQICSVDRNGIAQISFYDGSVKNISLKICIEKHLIEFLE